MRLEFLIRVLVLVVDVNVDVCSGGGASRGILPVPWRAAVCDSTVKQTPYPNNMIYSESAKGIEAGVLAAGVVNP